MLTASLVLQIENNLSALEEAIFAKERLEASQYARTVEEFCRCHFGKSKWKYALETAFAVASALFIAIVARQMWFELYEIPTGSMRPSFEEQDHLAVTKTAFGLNIPFYTGHFYFDPSLLRRGSVVVFSGDKIDLPDTDTYYFKIFPYKKRYIKRLIGKPGDALYFYGGKIYGIDKNGNAIEELLKNPWIEKLEHIPFITFEGRKARSRNGEIFFYQMHQPIGKAHYTWAGPSQGEVFDGKKWVEGALFGKGQEGIHSYGQYFGMDNFAMARIATKKELADGLKTSSDDAALYLQLRHTPHLTYSPSERLDARKRQFGVRIPTFETFLPLQKEHLDAIMDGIYTARFVVENEKARRYQATGGKASASDPLFEGVPDGTYEFQSGKAFQIGWKGIRTELPPSHPLYSRNPKRVQQLFNLGIEFDNAFSPKNNPNAPFPHRYAYFRAGELYLMGSPIFHRGDPVLLQFERSEKLKEDASTKNSPYLAFQDQGPPIKNGAYDAEFIRTFGVTVPEKHYLVLGDNHAMSADSRVFGFVPEQNIEGTPTFILWPPGSRWGWPPQTPLPFITLSRLVIWSFVILIAVAIYCLHRAKMRRRLFPKK